LLHFEGQAVLTVKIASITIMAVMLTVAVVTDLRSGKIYNWLTFPAMGAGLALGAIQGLPALGDRALGLSIAVVLAVVLQAAARMSGGDVKLLMAVGALQGAHFLLWAMLLTCVTGGLMAIVWIVRRRIVKQTALNLGLNVMTRAAGLRLDVAGGSIGGKMPYSIAVALGALAALLLAA
jgi:prepilin peptidase CpaA